MARRGRPTEQIGLSDDEREFLKGLIRRHKTEQRLVQRARILLLSAEGMAGTQVAEKVGTSNQTVSKWRKRYLEQGIEGLVDAPRSGKPRSIEDERVAELVRITLEEKPEGCTHWSTRQMAKRIGVSQSFVSRVWRTFGLQPHRAETFQLSSDPLFVEKVHDIVGLYMNPPDNAVVLCVDEKSQIQALNRTQPLLPMYPGQPERATHEYERNGTTSLFAALNIATGWVLGKCYKRHRSTEFLKFLKEINKAVPKELDVHVVLDNYATHKTPTVRNWLVKHPRFKLHFTPTHSSWLNMIESWFAALTKKQLKRGVHRSTKELEAAIYEFLQAHNKAPRQFVWRKTAEQILESVASLCERVLLLKVTN